MMQDTHCQCIKACVWCIKGDAVRKHAIKHPCVHMRSRKHTVSEVACRLQVPLLQDETVTFELRPMRSSAAGSGSGSDQPASLGAGGAELHGASACAARHSAGDNPGQGTSSGGFQLWCATDAAAPAAHLIPAKWREVRGASVLASECM